MDRETVSFGAVPLETDLLNAQRFAMVGHSVLAQTILGSLATVPTLVDGFTCVPTTPATLNVLVTPGSIYQMANLEATQWSSLGPDTHSILKQGILLDPATFGITPPGTVGFSQVFLIEAQYADLDTVPLTEIYFNSNNPAVGLVGAGGNGQAQNTVRKGIVSLQIKAGIAAATGSQVAPTVDSGFTGLFLITVANGATSITSGLITTLSSAPFLQTNGKLPLIPTGVQSGTWDYAVDTGLANAMVCTLAPIPTAYIAGMNFAVKVAVAVTGATTINVNSLGTKSIVHKDGSALIAGDLPLGAIANLRYDGTNFQLLGSGGVAAGVSSSWTYGSDYFADTSVTANIITGTPSASIGGAYAAGQSFLIKVANTVTGSTTINVSAVGAKTLKLVGGGLIQAGDIVAGDLIRVGYDGTNMILLSPIDQAIIDTSLTLVVGTGIYTDVNAAVAWLNRRRIAETGAVTISMPAGNYAYTTTQLVEHPDGQRISVQGGAVTSPPTGLNATFTNVSAAFSTQVTFTGPCGFLFKGPIGAVKNIMAIGGVGNSQNGFNFLYCNCSTVQNIASCKFGGDGIDVQYSNIISNGTYAIQNTGNGIFILGGKLEFQGSLGANVNIGNGVEILYGGTFTADTNVVGVCACVGNTGYGIYCDHSDCMLQGGGAGQLNGNTAGGFTSIYARFNISLITMSGNSGWTILLQGGAGQGNNMNLATGTQSINAGSGANLIATGSFISGTVTPPLNSAGNGNAYITY